MKPTVQVSLLLLLLSGAFVFVAGIPQRSARWDAFLGQPRHKRSASSWYSNHLVCAAWRLVQSPTAHDALQRRRSGLLSTPQNQGCCGSCWAFAVAHAYTDHLSIRARSLQDQISAQYLTACITNNRLETRGTQPINGCCGDSPVNAIRYFQMMGAVRDSCLSYTLSQYLSGVSKNEKLEYKRANPIQCPASCSDGTAFRPVNPRLRGYQQLSENQVLSALHTGPVIAGMNVPSRFFSYGCGVFCSDPADTTTGRHAVEIVDYGSTSSGLDYWVVKNSWGDDWGEDGYFRIQRGDRILVEFGTPVLSPSQPVSPTNIGSIACAPGTVSNPSQNRMVMSAVDVAMMQLNGHIPCQDNSPAMNLTFVSVANATSQIVDGVILTVDIMVNVQGCTQTTQANVSAVVDLNLNGTFELTDHTYQYVDNQVGGSAATTSNIILVIVATVMVVLTFAC